MAGWLGALAKTRNIISQVFSSKANIEEMDVEEIEEILLRSDVPARLTMEIVDELESPKRKATRKERLSSMLLKELGEAKTFEWPDQDQPHVIMLLGVNGSGKTTTSAKLAKKETGQRD